MASTPIQIFAVDTTTGTVAINANLFVRTAQKNTGWIKGDMIYAKSLITLANGAIVINGTNGTIQVKDPDNLNNGTYTYISNGYLRQYVNGSNSAFLTGIDAGQCSNNAWVNLNGTYSAAPSVFISPKNMNVFNATYNKQVQTFNLNTTTESLGSGKYRIKPVATIAVSASSDSVNVPAKTIYSAVGAGDGKNPFLKNGASVTLTSNSVTTGPNCSGVTVTASTFGVCCKAEDGLVDHQYNLTTASHKWRVKYKLTSASSWSYSSYTSATTATMNQVINGTKTLTFSAGTYDIAVEFVLTRNGTTTIGTSLPGTSEAAYINVNSILCTRPATTLTPSATFNYIAVGR